MSLAAVAGRRTLFVACPKRTGTIDLPKCHRSSQLGENHGKLWGSRDAHCWSGAGGGGGRGSVEGGELGVGAEGNLGTSGANRVQGSLLPEREFRLSSYWLNLPILYPWRDDLVQSLLLKQKR